ncbi:MAG: CDP-alcohol phosphatidyltransferase family protein [Alphaproteobacteria bacterium]|nr:CDP-alcohol phosphatidyltransferase family protein [Alphaproteobacteria bacterium]
MITVGRLCAVPITIYLIIADQPAAAFWLFIGAGISDGVDGFLAKQFHARTVIGGYLDPLADKALLVSVYVTLGYQGHLAAWLVILVVFRDALIVAGVLIGHALGHPFKLRPLMVSKVNTGLQIALAAAALARLGQVFDVGLVAPLVYLVAASTFASGAAYVAQGLRGAARLEGGAR